MNEQDDAINPRHYSDRNPQPIKVSVNWGLSFCLGNVIKYIARAHEPAGLGLRVRAV